MEYRLVRSKRKTLGIEIGPDAQITVRAPRYATKAEIEEVLAEKEAWILKNRRRILNRLEEENARGEGAANPYTDEELREMTRKARVLIPEKVRHFAPILGVTYGRITIRKQHARWGSCSSKGNLNFNCLLVLTPPEVQDYIVVHELAHRLEMNHSKRFYEIVSRVLPDYKLREQYLKNEGMSLMRRMPR